MSAGPLNGIGSKPTSSKIGSFKFNLTICDTDRDRDKWHSKQSEFSFSCFTVFLILERVVSFVRARKSAFMSANGFSPYVFLCSPYHGCVHIWVSLYLCMTFVLVYLCVYVCVRFVRVL